jgi:hypothetical protein
MKKAKKHLGNGFLQRWQGKSGLPNLADNKFET